MNNKNNSFYQKLIIETEAQRNDFMQIETIQLAARGHISMGSYQAFLTQAYHHVKHTTPLLMACGSRIPADKEWIRNAIAEYIEEEVGHQEWILNDLCATGIDEEIVNNEVRNGTADITTELMVAYAYDTISRNNPLSFFGMVLVLEGTSVAMATQAATKIQEKLKLPDEAFSYLTSHGTLDIEHMGFFEGLMDKVVDKNDQNVIIHAAKVFYKLYGDIFRALPL